MFDGQATQLVPDVLYVEPEQAAQVLPEGCVPAPHGGRQSVVVFRDITAPGDASQMHSTTEMNRLQNWGKA
jgi:hypothetical protein